MSKIAFALDVSDPREAARLIELLDPHVGAFKIGLEYFVANGNIPETSKPVILDLKLHDIPETVSRAVNAVCERSERIRYITMHVQQVDTINRAVKIAEQFGVTMLGVTVLTSMSMQDIADVEGAEFDGMVAHNLPEEHFVHLWVQMKARHAARSGMQGFVCSPQEVKWMRGQFPNSFLLVPGIRLGGPVGDDQKRIGTPAQAILDGASMVVVGRPIRNAEDPVAAAKQINESIAEATGEKQ